MKGPKRFQLISILFFFLTGCAAPAALAAPATTATPASSVTPIPTLALTVTPTGSPTERIQPPQVAISELDEHPATQLLRDLADPEEKQLVGGAEVRMDGRIITILFGDKTAQIHVPDIHSESARTLGYTLTWPGGQIPFNNTGKTLVFDVPDFGTIKLWIEPESQASGHKELFWLDFHSPSSGE